MKITINKQKVKQTFIVFLVLLLIVSVIFTLIQIFAPDSALAAQYKNFDTNKIFNGNTEAQNQLPSDSGVKLSNGFVNIAEVLATSVLLPIGIILATWRIIYLAIFPLILRIDPLDMMRSDRYTRNMKSVGSVLNKKGPHVAERLFGGNFESTDPKTMRSNTGATKYSGSTLDAGYFAGAYTGNDRGNDKEAIPQYAQHCIKVEVKFMFITMFVVFAVWGIIQLLIKLSVLFLGITEDAANGLTTP